MGVLHSDRRVLDPNEIGSDHPDVGGRAGGTAAAPVEEQRPAPPSRSRRRHGTDPPRPATHRRIGLVGLVVSFGVVAAVATLGSSWTDTGPGTWYEALDKPGWTPPGWVFGAVWTTLYALMAVAAWLVGRRGLRRPSVLAALALHGCQHVLNVGWRRSSASSDRPGRSWRSAPSAS